MSLTAFSGVRTISGKPFHIDELMSSLESALDILRCFSTATPNIGVTEVATKLGMPKSSVSRWMKVMGEAGLLEQDSTRRTYRPGALAFQLGNLYQRHLKVLDLVDQSLKELVESTGLTGYVGVLNDADIVIIQTRPGTYPVRLALEKGFRIPAFVTAVGLALLARLEDAEIRRLHPKVLHYEETDLTKSVEELLSDVTKVRRRGYAQVSGATFAGFGAMAVAVESRAEMQRIGFSLSFPHAALSRARREAIAAQMMAHARRIGVRTGDDYWAESAPQVESPSSPLRSLARGAGASAR
ncbi:MAG: IclR family transcriptional regulator [Burkholderiales bacterium]|nr:MAG: IclR family transcriptional regulator [Burkholderiales bacterium]